MYSVGRKIILGIIAVIFFAISVVALPVRSAYADEEAGGQSGLKGEPGYVRTVFNMSNGLPTDEANSVLQTRDGYLWVGSFGGLLRYNGTSFRNFSAEGAISTPSIRTLFEDSLGRLWIGSSDSGVFVYENGEFTSIPCTEKHGYLSIRDFAETADGKIFVASSSGVCEIADGVMTPLTEKRVTGETILSIDADRYNRVWCVLNSGECAVLKDGRCIAVLGITDFFPVNAKITCVTSDSSRNVYLGTTGKEFAKISFKGEALDGSDFSVTDYATNDALNHNRLSVTKDGDIFVSSQKGFAWVKSTGESVNSNVEGITGNVNCAAIDYEGNVWLASSTEGLVRYVKGYFSSPNSIAGLSGVDVNAVASAGGLYYAGTDDGLLAFDENWLPTSNALTEKLKSTHVQNLMTDSNGNLWCGTYSEFGVVRYNPSTGEIKTFNAKNGMESETVRISYEMKNGTVAVGTQDGVALIKGDEVVAFYDKDDGLETHSILCITEAPNGTLLAGSAGGGIYAIRQNGEITKYSYEQGLEDGVVLRIVPVENGQSGLVSAGSHLYYWSNGTFRRLDNLKIGVGSIYDICERNGRLWLMQDGGIYSVDKDRLLAGESVHATKYGIANGLTGSLNVNNWNYMSPDGNIYLATRNGISVFDFRRLTTYTPKLVINSISVDGVSYESPEKITLKSDVRRMTIRFSALTFSGSSDLCFAYRLVGFATNETVLSDVVGGSVSYTNLAGGNYTFRLRVYNPENPEEQETIEVTVIKEKSLIEQPMFWVAVAFLVVGAIFALSHFIVHTRTTRERREKQRYREIVGQALRTFANTIDAKDPYTNGHSVRVAVYSREIVRRMGFGEDDQEAVYYIALLHDIGKIAVPDYILNKTGKLTPEEMNIIKTHPAKGGEILKDFTAVKHISDGARYHHERYDGKGYCEGLSGEDIPLVGRIICVADSYDAMSADRCYRKALSKEKILEEFEKGSGTQFDPKIASIMIEMIKEGVVPVETPAEAKTTDESKITPPRKRFIGRKRGDKTILK